MAKEQTIEKLRSNREPARLYEAYNSYCYDSAYHYAQECVVLSDRTGDCNQKADARLKWHTHICQADFFKKQRAY